MGGAQSTRTSPRFHHRGTGLPEYACSPYFSGKKGFDRQRETAKAWLRGSDADAREDSSVDQCHFKVRKSSLQASADRTYDVELRGPNGKLELCASRTLAEFAEAHEQLRTEFPATAPADFLSKMGTGGCAGRTSATATSATLCAPFPSCTASQSVSFYYVDHYQATEQSSGWSRQLSEGSTVAGLQSWLNQVSEAGLLGRSPPLQSLLGLPGPGNLWAAPGVPSLSMIIECHQPLLAEIAGYVAESPRELAAFCGLARTVVAQIQFALLSLWREMYARRWPAFAECLIYHGLEDWWAAYRETLTGRLECTLEVFDREKKLGFAMAAMAARTQYEASIDGYIVRYLSASEVLPETIPICEEHRLRFCPLSARPQLEPGVVTQASDTSDMRLDCSPRESKSPTAGRAPCYPYRVLEGTEGLRVGQGVELQWKMQFGSPFGWWFGHLEELHKDPDGGLATAVITFRHFPATSRWYRLAVRFGDSELRPCTFGGYTGGIRPVSEDENRHWMRFFPKDPVVF